MIYLHVTPLVVTSTAGCIVFAVVITFTLLICISHKSNHKPRGKRTTEDGELFRHPLFVSQRQNLALGIEVQSSNETEAALRTNAAVVNGIHNAAGKVENDRGIKTSDESRNKKQTSIDYDIKKSATKSTSLPDGIDGNKKENAKVAKKSNLPHSVSSDHLLHKPETECQSPKNTDHVNNCCKGTDAVANTRKVNKEPIGLEVIVKRSTACTLDLSKQQADNISLMTNSAYGSTSRLRRNSTSPEIYLAEEGNNHISLMTNNAYGSSLNLGPNSCYNSDIKKQLAIGNEHGMSFLQLPIEYSYIHNEDDDDDDNKYSYVSATVHAKTSTWPSVLRDTDLPPIDINGIYVDLDHSFQEEKTPLSNVRFATDESPYY